MDVLGRWDRRNQRMLEAHHRRREFVRPGGVVVSSGAALLEFLLLVPIGVVLLVQGTAWNLAAGVGVLALAVVLLAVLGHEVVEDLRALRAQRAAGREPSA